MQREKKRRFNPTASCCKYDAASDQRHDMGSLSTF